jgi:hypothetical protein
MKLVSFAVSRCTSMVRLDNQGARKSRRKHKNVAAVVAGLVSGMVAIQARHNLYKTPMHTSILTGEGWIQELLTGHPARFRRSMGMSKHVFQRLVQELHVFARLCPTKYVSMNEQVAIFMYICVSGDTNRQAQERFQCSGDTISRYVILN